MQKKISLMLFVVIDILIALAVIIITFSSSKDYFIVKFELNGGVLLEGDLEQTVKYGDSARPPLVSKDGEIFLEWSEDWQHITEDKTIYAVWDVETTFGIQFQVYYNGNYCLVHSSFENISGDVYISAFYGERSVLGISDKAFLNRNRLNSITLPNSIFSIGKQAFMGCTSLSTIKLPESLVSIEESAFDGCTSLTSIVLPDSVVSIGKNAFSNCTNLQSLTLGPNVKDITPESLMNLTNLEEINVSPENPYYQSIDGNLYTKDGTTLLKYASGKKDEIIVLADTVEVIADYAFDHALNLKKIEIPNNLYDIEANSIYQCENIEYTEYSNGYYLGNQENPYKILYKCKDLEITDVVVHNNTIVIYSEAFKGCTKLETIELSQGLTSIGDSAFSGCTNLKGLTLPSTIDSIGIGVFEGCYSLESIVIPQSIIEISDSLFLNCTALTTVELPHNLSRIGKNAFSGCLNLESILLPDSLQYIDNSAFYNCIVLTDIVIPNGIISIGRGAFQNCISLTSITLPFIGHEMEGESSTNFGYIFGAIRAVNNKTYVPTSLKKVVITKDTRIAASAFQSCENIEEIYLPKTLTSINSNAFYNCNGIQKVYYDGDVDNWCKLSIVNKGAVPHNGGGEIYFNDKNDNYYLVEEIVISEDIKSINEYQFYGFINLKRVVLSENMSEISSNAFVNCKALEYVYIGQKVNNIHLDAFLFSNPTKQFEVSTLNNTYGSLNGDVYSKDFKTLYFASLSNKFDYAVLDGVEKLGENIFAYTELASITLPNTLKEIGDNAFYTCLKLENIIFNKGLEKIGDNAFSYSAVTSITLPDTVISVGDSAFAYCNNLTQVVLSNALEIISINMFYQCGSLKTVIIPNSVKTISNYAFAYCSALQKISLPTNLITIGNSSFESCTTLQDIFIPLSVENIGSNAFNNCLLFMVLCAAPEKPAGWDDTWIPSNKIVLWNQIDRLDIIK